MHLRPVKTSTLPSSANYSPDKTTNYLAITGSYLQRMRDAIEFAEKNRVRASMRREELRARAVDHLTARATQTGMRAPTDIEIDVHTDTLAVSDPKFKLYVENEQWGCRLGAMYAAAHAAECSQYTTNFVKTIMLTIIDRFKKSSNA